MCDYGIIIIGYTVPNKENRRKYDQHMKQKNSSRNYEIHTDKWRQTWLIQITIFECSFFSLYHSIVVLIHHELKLYKYLNCMRLLGWLGYIQSLWIICIEIDIQSYVNGERNEKLTECTLLRFNINLWGEFWGICHTIWINIRKLQQWCMIYIWANLICQMAHQSEIFPFSLWQIADGLLNWLVQLVISSRWEKKNTHTHNLCCEKRQSNREYYYYHYYCLNLVPCGHNMHRFAVLLSSSSLVKVIV